MFFLNVNLKQKCKAYNSIIMIHLGDFDTTKNPKFNIENVGNVFCFHLIYLTHCFVANAFETMTVIIFTYSSQPITSTVNASL